MASGKQKRPSDGGGSSKVILAAVGIAAISGLSSFVAIRFAMPHQVIIEKHIITEHGQVVPDKPDEKKVEQATEIYPIGDFIVNLADPGRHYLKTSIALQMIVDGKPQEKKSGEGEGKKDDGSAIKAEYAQFEPLYKDAINSTLSSETSLKLTAPGGRELLKDELKVALNKVVPNKKVLGVFFTDFVIQ